jgi:hypothetical protein
MRSLILSTSLIFAVSVASAQQIILGLNAGAAVSNDLEKRDSYPYNDVRAKANIDPSFSFKAGIAQKNTEYGLSVSLSRFSVMVDDRVAPEKPTSDVHFGYTPRVAYRGHNTMYVMADKALTFQFYLDHHLRFNKFDLYFGGAMGQGRFFTVDRTDDRVYVNDGEFYAWQARPTFTTSLEVGTTYHITKRIGINTELRGNMIIPYDLKTGNYRYLYSIPLTLGIQYTFL